MKGEQFGVQSGRPVEQNDMPGLGVAAGGVTGAQAVEAAWAEADLGWLVFVGFVVVVVVVVAGEVFSAFFEEEGD